ncbi:MAG: LacI family DNA-binding transcriptional regulator [Planctomycetes bacterium]|nr:LacI family DNA-binding transcriptional regulator [Planctomycetota bacterium]
MSVTLKEIATCSGCSVTTVSRVLRQQGDISEDTRVRVMDAAKKLKYRPNFLVRGIQTGKTMTIGMVTLLSDYHAQILQGVHDRLIEDEYVAIVLRNDKKPDGSFAQESETNQIHRLVDRRIDGIIMTPVEDEENEAYLREIRNHELPLVLVDRDMPNAASNFVGSDDYLGGKMAAEHLLENGHRRIAHLAGPDFVTTARLRKEGFLDALKAAGINDSVVITDKTFADGMAQARELLSSADRPTAIFTANDLLAAGTYKAAAELGISIPDDLSVVGFGNLSFGEMINPALTTFDQQPYNIGRIAADMLLEMINPEASAHESKPVKKHLAPILIPRKSVRSI